ncbi:uncharacterized protein LOC117501876 isoform X2 [Thalassophryne amazonica]|uniref:uncharacterized protein LOC117501876 isoform X2 n=1 Tax=Thalassophryne amazonica TaxID=390379 RepID=UPI001471B87F|nr:uncharacterized protein LOC117501876 isoform X2 [Thalassophryne amazonica]
MEMRDILQLDIVKEVKDKGPGQLQILELPEKLIQSLEASTYCTVMQTLSGNEKLASLLKDGKPKRMMMQAYQRDHNRNHVLLGMQHIVECTCVGQTEKTFYLCTHCCEVITTCTIIKHVISFDHLFSYIQAWHPKTLNKKKVYTVYSSGLALKMSDFAKQSLKIHQSSSTDMKQVSLEPAVFSSVSSLNYVEALKKLQSIRKEKRESNLKTLIKPGQRLKCVIFKLHCQNCDVICDTVLQYFTHVQSWNHNQNMIDTFGSGSGCNPEGSVFNPGQLQCLKKYLIQTEPIIGEDLLVMCLNTEELGDQCQPFFLCFACKECFSFHKCREHITSKKHLVCTLLHQNPWKLPFAWKEQSEMLDILVVLAREMKMNQEPNQLTLKIFDIPIVLFGEIIGLNFSKVLRVLLRFSRSLINDVPYRKTFFTHPERGKFPLLGQHFMVEYNMRDMEHSIKRALLCLLCQMKIPESEGCNHVFSWQHVVKFLNSVHPGSLGSSKVNYETLLDLAQQAAYIHSVYPVLRVLTDPIRQLISYPQTSSILADAYMKQGKGKLKWRIVPHKKLVPTEVKKDDVKDGVEKASGMTEGSEEDTSQKDTEDCETPEENGAEASKQSVECGKNVEKGPEIFAQGEEERENEVLAKTVPEPIQSMCDEKRQIMEEGEKTDGSAALSTTEPSEPSAESGLSMDTDDGAESENSEAADKGLNGLFAKLCNQRLLTTLHECSSLPTTEKNLSPATGVDEQDILLGVADMKPEIDSNVSKQHFDPVTVKLLEAQQHTRWDSPPSCVLSGVTPAHTSVTAHAKEVGMADNYQVVDMDLSDSEKWEQPSFLTSSRPNTTKATVKAESIHKGDKATPQSRDGKMNLWLNFPDSSNTCLSEDASLLHRSSSRDGTICMQPDSTEIKFKDKITLNATLDKNMMPVTSISNVTTSDMKTSKSKALPKALESTTGTASKVQAASCKDVATCRTRTPPLHTGASKNSEGILETPLLSQTKAETVHPTKMDNKKARTEGSAKPLNVKNPMEPKGNIGEHMSNKHTTSMNVRAEQTTSYIKLPSDSMAKSEVGLSYLIAVTCEGKRQVYCQLCSVRLKQTLHLRTFAHHYNYVKSKFPEWTTMTSEEKKRKLAKTVTQLVEAEKKSGSKGVQRLKVNSIQYKELADLSGKEAVKRVKEMMRQQTDQQDVPSTISDHGAETMRWHMPSASPCDGPIEHEMESNSNEDNSMTKCAEPGEPITSEPHSRSASNGISAECITTPSIQDVSIRVTEQERFESDVDIHAKVQITATLRSPDVVQLKTDDELNTDSTACKEEKHSDSPHLLITDSESPHASVPTLNKCQETSDTKQQLGRSNSDLQGTPEPEDGKQTIKTLDPDLKTLDGSVKSPVSSRRKERRDLDSEDKPQDGKKITSAVASSEPELKSSAASGNMKEQSSARMSQRDNHVLQSTQHTSRGLGSVWECRGASMNMDTFFLCESCRQTLSRDEICKHMFSSEHHLNYMQRAYLKFLSFWFEDDLHEYMKLTLLKEVAGLLSDRERFNKIDSVVILLSLDAYDFARTAPFSEALNLVRNIRKQKQSATYCPLSAPQQKETMRRGKTRFEEAADTATVKRRRTLPDVNTDSNIYSKVTSHPRQKQVKCKDIAVGTALRFQACQLSSQTQPYLLAQEEDLFVETQSFSDMFHKTSPSPSAPSRQQCFPTERATFGAPVKSLVRPSTHNPQFGDHLPAIYSLSHPGFTSEMTFDNTASAPISMCFKDNNGRPESASNASVEGD